MKPVEQHVRRPLSPIQDAKNENGEELWAPRRSLMLDETLGAYEQPLVVPQLTHLWQLPLGIMIDPHSGQVGASVRAMKL